LGKTNSSSTDEKKIILRAFEPKQQQISGTATFVEKMEKLHTIRLKPGVHAFISMKIRLFSSRW
jgi:hypothetical protein